MERRRVIVLKRSPGRYYETGTLLGAGLGGGGVPGVPGQADYSKLLAGGSQGLYHSFMQNSYMTSQLNMTPHQSGLPNLPSSY